MWFITDDFTEWDGMDRTVIGVGSRKSGRREIQLTNSRVWVYKEGEN